MKIKLLFLILIFGSWHLSNAQDDLLDILDKELEPTDTYTAATFKMTRIAIGHSIETRKKGILEIVTTNRFWNTPTERSQSFVADRLTSRIALEYGISDRLSTGLGGTTWDGLFDGYLKYKLLRQKEGGGSPLSITLFQNTSYNSNAFPQAPNSFSDRLSFTSQLLIGKKISSDFSVQLAPTFIHRGNLSAGGPEKNHFALGLGARFKLTPHLSLVSEYYYRANPITSFDNYAPFAIGVNWELGDIMLQFNLTNAQRIVEDAFITQTRYNFNFKNPNLNFGFNATYVIHFKRHLK
ncbi:MAG: hypothetical protein Mars2KO_43390 [Maribacter sp.]|uniref:DUF5777 family beta-barrel protein n=1 Tax=Maribacter sp. 2307UL18-2 TaxID=3386274 RepID=UPI0039BCEAEB